MIEAKDLSPNIWDEAINCDVYVHNRSTHKELEGKTPFEAQSGHNPNVSHFRVFGSKGWDKIPPQKRKELKPKIKESIMVGYAEYSKGYNLFDPSSQKTFSEMSVQYEEESMQQIELVKGEGLHPPLHYDVSDDYLSYVSDSYIEDDVDEMHSDHD